MINSLHTTTNCFIFISQILILGYKHLMARDHVFIVIILCVEQKKTCTVLN